MNIKDEDSYKNQDFSQQKNISKYSKITIAGILLIIAGIFTLIMWIPLFTIDIQTIESYIDIAQFQSISPNITVEDIKDIFVLCGVIGCVLSIFCILGGILALKKKLWGVSVVSCIPLIIIGVFISVVSLVFIASIIAFFGLILLIMARKEY
jgi:hypothetical protein